MSSKSSKKIRRLVDKDLLSAQKTRKKELVFYNSMFLLLELFLPAIIVAILLNFVFGISQVYGESMVPTFDDGDYVLYARYDNNPDYNEVIVAEKPGHEHVLIKRVIGLPGDIIDIQNGVVTINGNPVDSTGYITIGITTLHDVTFPLTLGENEYFLMGDNREISLDSRSAEIGPITQDNILGEVIFFLRVLK